ncbi:Alpha/beta hydrolase family-domain-containing protein [Lineolata rhizophorae]|uniref:Alpha/beta hydrolase family-domain-containing protein n=1 Tax=Lineolata rhizophorae TaxID=578093 RepID=A0A6A6PAT2_9PEZI|nr:Alpha/beta hydrolase family-domain-containing protein [Lineolata rhizophorae]
MSSQYFRVDCHVFSGQHVRGYPHATIDGQEEELKLVVKQYRPFDNLNPKPGDVTIIGAHANGFPKELYEPLWDELYKRSKGCGFNIRAIWIADAAHQGESGVLNENKLGNEPNWFDNARDLLQMVNVFRTQMVRPMIGIGHSYGGHSLVNLSLMHPRLLETLVLIDPVFMRVWSREGSFRPAYMSSRRRDIWPSRAAAAQAFKKSPFYQAWDPRVLENWLQYGLRELPTTLYPHNPEAASPRSSSAPRAIAAPTTAEPTIAPPATSAPDDRPVTLTTTKHQEVFTFLRPAFAPTGTEPLPDRLRVPDLDPSTLPPEAPFYRAEGIMTFNRLPELRPSVLYIFGSASALSAPEAIADKMKFTGVGMGGSGGAEKGEVEYVVLKDAGHLIPMERVVETAEESSRWVGKRLARWREDEELMKRQWQSVREEDKTRLAGEYMECLENIFKDEQKKRTEKL